MLNACRSLPRVARACTFHRRQCWRTGDTPMRCTNTHVERVILPQVVLSRTPRRGADSLLELDGSRPDDWRGRASSRKTRQAGRRTLFGSGKVEDPRRMSPRWRPARCFRQRTDTPSQAYTSRNPRGCVSGPHRSHPRDFRAPRAFRRGPTQVALARPNFALRIPIRVAQRFTAAAPTCGPPRKPPELRNAPLRRVSPN
jgi:hypothetical protein